MQRKLFVCSKAMPVDGKEGYFPRLIGILTELEPADGFKRPGVYQFEYKTGGSFPEWYLQLADLPDANKIYGNEYLYWFLSRYLPTSDFKYLKLSLKSIGLKKYDEWACLVAFGPRNAHQDHYLYENLPEGTICYEPVE